MPRIRSVHPGLFTDESFMDASPLARLFLIGIWCEAYDDGVFDWKPRQLKIKLLPLEKSDPEALLQELQDLGFLHRYRFKGKDLGIVRKFQKWQTPQKPKPSNLLPPELIPYAAAGTAWPIRVGDDYDIDTVTIPSGEEGRGGERKGEETRLAPSCAGGASAKAGPKIVEATRPTEAGRPAAIQGDPAEARWRLLVADQPVILDPDLTPIRALLREPNIGEADVSTGIEAMIAKGRRKPRCWADFDGWIRRAAKDRMSIEPSYPGQAPPDTPATPEQIRSAQFSMALNFYRGEWRNGHPNERKPEHPDCTTPAEILAEAKAQAARERGDEQEAA